MLLDPRLFDRQIAFHRVFVQFGGVKVALFLSQAMYWTIRVDPERDGWFFKTQAEWEEETGLTRREQESCRLALKNLGILSENLRGIPAKMWFRIDIPVLSRLLSEALNQESDRQVCAPEPKQCGGNEHDCMAETAKLSSYTTTEITTETTPSFLPSAGVCLDDDIISPPPVTKPQPKDSYEEFISNFNRGPWRHANPNATAPKRRGEFRARMKDPWWTEHYMEGLARAFNSDFLTGKVSGQWCGKGMDLEFFLRPNTLAYILEGKYDNPGGGGGQSGPLAKWNPVD